jgi:phenylacetate-coenzyme A ligase PaaK-like adenylate-forming protein
MHTILYRIITEFFSHLKISPEDIKTKEHLRKIPVVTKEDIRKNAA